MTSIWSYCRYLEREVGSAGRGGLGFFECRVEALWLSCFWVDVVHAFVQTLRGAGRQLTMERQDGCRPNEADIHQVRLATLEQRPQGIAETISGPFCHLHLVGLFTRCRSNLEYTEQAR